MDKIDPCDTMKNNLIAAALGLQQCTKTGANIVPIPGGERVIAIGTPAQVARLLDIAPVSAQLVEPDEVRKLLERAHRVISCAAIVQIRDGEKTWEDIGKYLAASPATVAAPTLDEQDKFEAHYRALMEAGKLALREQDFARTPSGNYFHMYVGAYWHGWKQRATTVTVPAQPDLRKSVRAIVQLVRDGEWADLLDMDEDAAALWQVVDGLLQRVAAPAAQQAAPMGERYADLLRVQRTEAETGDPYMLGLYNGMLMMCANEDGKIFDPLVVAAPATAGMVGQDAKDAAPVIPSYDIEKVKWLKFQFVESLIHNGIQYRTCGAISATLNRIIDASEAAALAAQQAQASTTDDKQAILQELVDETQAMGGYDAPSGATDSEGGHHD